MANIYVRSTDGSDSDNGSTWALAKATATGAAAIDAAGDTIYLSDAHSESTASAVTIALAGTVAAPTKVIAGDDAAEPPTAVATATIATTGANALIITGSAYFEGLILIAGSGGSTTELQLNKTAGGSIQRYNNCSLRLGTSHATGRIDIGQDSSINGMLTELINTTLSYANTSQRLEFGGTLVIKGGSFVGGSSAITTFLEARSQRGTRALIEDFDMSAAAQALVLMVGGTAIGCGGTVVFRRCKLPASWSGTLVSTALTIPGTRAEMYNCAAGDTNYALWIEDYAGSIRHETTIVLTGGASDGTTPISWKMVSGANASYPMNLLYSSEMGDWIETVGGSTTLTVEFIHDSVTDLNDDEIWLEVDYLGTSGFPLGTLITDAKATVLTGAAAQASSSATWTTTGLTNPNTQKLSVTFTPQEKGFYSARVALAKASTTVYVDSKIIVS
jgi:hypothetical protein